MLNKETKRKDSSAPYEFNTMSLLPRRQPVDVEFSDLSYVVPTGRRKKYTTILHEVSGKFRSGRLTAIMGPSGAGKTTLMNIIAGYKISNVSGSIRVNGCARIIRQFRRSSCYIMQEDHHLPHLTVGEAMNAAATLMLGESVSEERKKCLIDEIMKTLSLDTCVDTRTINLSGGQRKRLSIAVELVNNPPVMFFDEPTSGLDSQNSMQCMNLLKSLATGGRTIICTIHQPSARIFETFDYLYAVAEGQCIYRGTIDGLLPFLSIIDKECPSFHNPADFLIEVATSGEFTHKLVNAVLNGKCNNLVLKNDKPDTCTLNSSKAKIPKSEENKETSQFLPFTNGNTTTLSIEPLPTGDDVFGDTDEFYATSTWQQFKLLSKRNYISIMRDTLLTKMRFSSHIVVGFLFGILYFGIGDEASKFYSNCGLLFCCIFFCLFAGMLPTVLTFPLEMKVVMREHHNCWYSLKSYYLAKTMGDIPFQIAYPTFFVTIVYLMTSQPLEVSRYLMFNLICILVSFVAQSLAVTIGAAMEVQEATFFAPIISIPIMMFSGFYVTISTIPFYIRWLTYASYLRYGYEGILQAVYGFGREDLHCSRAYCHHKSPIKIMEELDFENGIFWVDILALIAFLVFLRIVGYFVLRWKIRSER